MPENKLKELQVSLVINKKELTLQVEFEEYEPTQEVKIRAHIQIYNKLVFDVIQEIQSEG